MALKLKGELCAIRVSLGQYYNGLAPIYETALNIEGVGRTWNVRTGVETMNMKAFGDAYKQYVPHSGDFRVQVKNFVPQTGWIGFSTGTPEGRYIKIEVKELATMIGYKVFEGIVTEWEGESDADGPQGEQFTIMGPVSRA